ncbi:MAG TPA: glycosyltransferase family 39 protein [Candidatus Bathyarchaeia archaeon]|nr:glycosyltransferase family 39 protein [Candidatus Bathyarchaeia archaeon]
MPQLPHSANPAPLSLSVPTSRLQRILHSTTWMIVIGFLVRVLYIALAHSYRFRTTDANFGFGWEIGRIAYSIAGGRGYSSPFGGNTGPSAWTAPIYPFIVSLAFRIFGAYSHAASFALLTFNSLCAALTCWPVVRIARRVFGEKVALWSGWIWALLPYIIYWSVRWIWETSAAALLFTLAFMLTVEMEGENRLTSWIGFGVLWGVIGLTNPSCLSFLPFAGCWLAYRLYQQRKRFLLPAVVGAVMFWLTMMPWLVRNFAVFHKLEFVRDNVGVELRCGNNPLAEGIWVAMYHPSQNPILLRRYEQMGEAAYAAEQGRLAKQWIAANPRQFATITFRKFVFFWNGLPRLSSTAEWMQAHPHHRASRLFWPVIFDSNGRPRSNVIEALQQTRTSLFLATSLLAFGGLYFAVRNRVHAVFLFVSLIVFYPLVYYVSFPHPRYRHPIDPMLLMLTVYLFTQARPRRAHTTDAR